MSLLANCAISAKNQCARRVEARAGAELNELGAGDTRRTEIDHTVLANSHPAVKPEVCALNIPNIERGETVRRALLAVARLCHQRRVPLPRYHAIGQVVGISDTEVARHLALLRAAGALSLCRDGRRIRVEGIGS